MKTTIAKVGMKSQNKPLGHILMVSACVFFGNALLAFGIAAFLIPHEIISDGTTGIGIVLNKVFPNFDTAWLILALNILLLFFGFAVLGKKFFFTTIAGTILYPVMLAGFQRIPGIDSLTKDATLAAIIGGLVIGIGMGLTMRAGSSTGGMDILALVFHRWFHIPVSAGIYILGFTVIGGQAFFSAPEKAILGILLLVIESVMIEQVILIGKAQVQIFAVSDYYEEIRKLLLTELNLGVTMMTIETGHLEKQQQGILCILSPRRLHEATGLIQKIDPNAFITVTKIREVHGRGYNDEY